MTELPSAVDPQTRWWKVSFSLYWTRWFQTKLELETGSGLNGCNGPSFPNIQTAQETHGSSNPPAAGICCPTKQPLHRKPASGWSRARPVARALTEIETIRRARTHGPASGQIGRLPASAAPKIGCPTCDERTGARAECLWAVAFVTLRPK